MEEQKLNLEDFFAGIAKSIRDNFETSKLTKHRGIKGANREDIVKKFLKQNLPEIFGVRDGEIFDSTGRISGQCDIIIFDKNKPIFRNDTQKFFPIESVYGVVEIKSNLDKDELKKAVINIQKIKQMALENPRGAIIFGKFHNRVYYSIFAFEAEELQNLKQNLSELHKELNVPKEEQVDLICVLDKLIYLNNPAEYGWYEILPTGERKELLYPFALMTAEKTLFWFISVMKMGFNHSFSTGVDFMKYSKSQPQRVDFTE